MSKKFTAIAVSVFILVSTVTLLADEKADEENSPSLQKELESQQPGDLQQVPRPAELGRQPVARRRIRARREEQVDIDVAEGRIRVNRQQLPAGRQAPARLGRVAQLQNRWFSALKEAHREGDMDRVGRLIDRMEQFRKQVRNRMESAQQMRPLQRQRRRADEGYQSQGRKRDFRSRRRDGGPIEEAPASRRQLRQQHHRRLRMQDVPDRHLQRPAAPPAQGYCENCNCEKCRQIRAGQQQRLGRPGIQGRGHGRFGTYEEQVPRQRQLRQGRGWQQQEPPRRDVPEGDELDFDWDW